MECGRRDARHQCRSKRNHPTNQLLHPVLPRSTDALQPITDGPAHHKVWCPVNISESALIPSETSRNTSYADGVSCQFSRNSLSMPRLPSFAFRSALLLGLATAAAI